MQSLRLYDVDGWVLRLEAPTDSALLDCCFQNGSIAFSAGSDCYVRRFVVWFQFHACSMHLSDLMLVLIVIPKWVNLLFEVVLSWVLPVLLVPWILPAILMNGWILYAEKLVICLDILLLTMLEFNDQVQDGFMWFLYV